MNYYSWASVVWLMKIVKAVCRLFVATKMQGYVISTGREERLSGMGRACLRMSYRQPLAYIDPSS